MSKDFAGSNITTSCCEQIETHAKFGKIIGYLNNHIGSLIIPMARNY